jgi:hypothetical protein
MWLEAIGGTIFVRLVNTGLLGSLRNPGAVAERHQMKVLTVRPSE